MESNKVITQIEENSLYRHYKGNLYYVHVIGKHTETEETLVVYQAAEVSKSGDVWLQDYDKVWCRPLTNFCEMVQLENGDRTPRFVQVK